MAKKVTEPKVNEAVEPAPKVKVYKINADTVTSFCGEKVQFDRDGREFFELAEDLKPLVDENINLIWPAIEADPEQPAE